MPTVGKRCASTLAIPSALMCTTCTWDVGRGHARTSLPCRVSSIVMRASLRCVCVRVRHAQLTCHRSFIFCVFFLIFPDQEWVYPTEHNVACGCLQVPDHFINLIPTVSTFPGVADLANELLAPTAGRQIPDRCKSCIHCTNEPAVCLPTASVVYVAMECAAGHPWRDIRSPQQVGDPVNHHWQHAHGSSCRVAAANCYTLCHTMPVTIVLVTMLT